MNLIEFVLTTQALFDKIVSIIDQSLVILKS